MARWRSG